MRRTGIREGREILIAGSGRPVALLVSASHVVGLGTHP